jgi:hypothetical protein
MAAKLEISIFALWAVSTSFINQLSRRLTGAIRFGTDCKSAPAGESSLHHIYSHDYGS